MKTDLRKVDQKKIDELVAKRIKEQEQEWLMAYQKSMKGYLTTWLEKKAKGVKFIGVIPRSEPFGVAVYDEPLHNIHYFLFAEGQEEMFFEFERQKRIDNNWIFFNVQTLGKANRDLFTKLICD